MRIIKVGSRYINLDLLVYAYDEDEDDGLTLVMAAPEPAGVGGEGVWSVQSLAITFRSGVANEVRRHLDIAARTYIPPSPEEQLE